MRWTLAVILALARLCLAGEARLLVYPEQISLGGPDRVHGLLVTRVEADGRCVDATRGAKLASSAPDIARIDEKGQVVAEKDGSAEVQVVVGNLTTQLAVHVSALEAKPVPSFRNDIEPLLTKSGCNQGSCHGKLAGQNGF